jgi:hypothetical protein
VTGAPSLCLALSKLPLAFRMMLLVVALSREVCFKYDKIHKEGKSVFTEIDF